MTPVVVPGLFFYNIQRHGISFLRNLLVTFKKKIPHLILIQRPPRDNVFNFIT